MPDGHAGGRTHAHLPLDEGPSQGCRARDRGLGCPGGTRLAGAYPVVESGTAGGTTYAAIAPPCPAVAGGPGRGQAARCRQVDTPHVGTESVCALPMRLHFVLYPIATRRGTHRRAATDMRRRPCASRPSNS